MSKPTPEDVAKWLRGLKMNYAEVAADLIESLQADAQRKDEALRDTRHFIEHVREVTESVPVGPLFAGIQSALRKIDAALSVGQQEKGPLCDDCGNPLVKHGTDRSGPEYWCPTCSRG